MRTVPLVFHLLSVVCLLALAPASQQLLGELTRKAEVVKPGPEELRWQRIPWTIDLAEGVRAAREENRPLFIVGGPEYPLQRC